MRVEIHKHARKSLEKSPKKIQRKFLEFVEYCLNDKLNKVRFPIVLMKGKFKIYKEAKIDKDYRIIFRIEDNIVYIRYAGTHNYLGTA